MEKGQDNGTSRFGFLLAGMGNVLTPQTMLFLLSLIIYLVTMVGNILIVVLVVAEHHLHTPMYFFLSNLSSLETSYSSTFLPHLLTCFLTGDRTISASGGVAQFYFFAVFATAECHLLAAVSYNWYLAICQPLLYTSLMTWKVCLQLVAGSWLLGLMVSMVLTSLLPLLQFCGPRTIDHFFCNLSPLLELSCSDTSMATLVAFICGFLDAVFPFLFTLASYVCIVAAILRIPSNVGRNKAFCTCSSHLTIVAVFDGSLFVVYVLSRTAWLWHLSKVFSFFYTVLVPLVNPLIYSPRNRQVREALKKGLWKALASTQTL